MKSPKHPSDKNEIDSDGENLAEVLPSEEKSGSLKTEEIDQWQIICALTERRSGI
jgi:hypothetical protein